MADHMGITPWDPRWGASPLAAVLKVVNCLGKDSEAGSRGMLGPGTGTGIGTLRTLSNSLILPWSVQVRDHVVHHPRLVHQDSVQLGLVVLLI